MRLLLDRRGERARVRGRGCEAAPRRRDRRRGLGLTEPRVSYLVGRLDRALRRRLGDALRPHGLSLAEYTTLSVIRARSGLSNAQLARRSLITPQAMNEVLARLEQRRFVRRTAATQGRVRPAELTRAGERVLQAADAHVDAVERELLAGVDEPALRDLLAAALSNIR